MARKKVVEKRAYNFKPANLSSNTPQRARIVGAFTWGAMTDAEKRDCIELGVLVAMAPHQWDAMMREQGIAAQAKDNLREELRVSNLKLSNLETRFREKDIENMHHVESLRTELSKARDDVYRINRAMHALIDGIATPRGAGQSLSMSEVVERLRTKSA